jgi:hypothetical protein
VTTDVTRFLVGFIAGAIVSPVAIVALLSWATKDDPLPKYLTREGGGQVDDSYDARLPEPAEGARLARVGA